MIDGFPLVDGASDSQIQVLIGSDLETATRVKEEFARANPGFEERFRELLKQRVSIVAMGLRRPGQEQLYPELMKTTYRREWLFPLVRRFLWNYAQGEGGARWCGEISAMISPVMMGVRDVTDAEFLELAAAAAPLKSYSCLLYCSKLGSFFAAREKREPLTPPLLAAARALLPLCGDHSEELKKFAWPQFRDEAGLADADWGWSVRLHRELSGLKKKDRTLWLKVLDGTPIRANSRRAAAAKVGNTEIERFLRRSIELLREDAEVELSPFGAVLFCDLIGLCELMGGNACDEILYEIARTNWKRIRAPYWPAEYLRTMERRPPDRAFACLEAMLMNPVTGDQFVRRRYDALATTFAAREQVSAPIGADGYVLESDWELRQQQARIDQLLQMGASAADQGGWDPPNSVKHPDYFRLTPAAHEAI